MKKAMFLTMDAVLSVLVGITILSIIIVTLTDVEPSASANLDIAVPIYLNSIHQSGDLIDALTNDATMVTSVDRFSSLGCLNITFYDDGGTVGASGQTSGCTMDATDISAATIYVYQNATFYSVRALGWKE